MDRPVLIIFTDGGPDHRPTFESVKVSLLALFVQLDLDMLVALRTAPNNSWMNLAERVMPVLNLALQHCALCRDSMQENSEKKMRNKGCMTAVRNLAESDPLFKEEFIESVASVIESVNSRFERMKIKGVPIKTGIGLSDAVIECLLQPLRGVVGEDGFTAKSSAKDLRKCSKLMAFLADHSKCGHYLFQLRKCTSDSCAYCIARPRRLADEVHFVPDPQPAQRPDVAHTYQSFEEVGN